MIKLNLNLEPKKNQYDSLKLHFCSLILVFILLLTKMLLVIKYMTKIQETCVSEVYTDAFLCQAQSLHALV